MMRRNSVKQQNRAGIESLRTLWER
ncbi:hypothetical protein A2U01_0004736, partial [Trifolium medium]|nr:hypothetical protein [Trifolium medium]